MIGRIRPADATLGLLGLFLLWATLELPIVEFDGAARTAWEALSVIRWLLLAVALVAICIPLVTVVRRTATVALALSVLASWLAPLVLALTTLRLVLFAPAVAGVEGSPTGGAIVIDAGLVLIGLSLLWAMRDERRGLRPGPGAPVKRMEAPAADQPAGSG